MALFRAKVQDAQNALTGSTHPLVLAQEVQLVLALAVMCIAQTAQRDQLLADVQRLTQTLSVPLMPTAPAVARVSTQLISDFSLQM